LAIWIAPGQRMDRGLPEAITIMSVRGRPESVGNIERFLPPRIQESHGL
jgi:hypothetical protein